MTARRHEPSHGDVRIEPTPLLEESHQTRTCDGTFASVASTTHITTPLPWWCASIRSKTMPVRPSELLSSSLALASISPSEHDRSSTRRGWKRLTRRRALNARTSKRSPSFSARCRSRNRKRDSLASSTRAIAAHDSRTSGSARVRAALLQDPSHAERSRQGPLTPGFSQSSSPRRKCIFPSQAYSVRESPVMTWNTVRTKLPLDSPAT